MFTFTYSLVLGAGQESGSLAAHGSSIRQPRVAYFEVTIESCQEFVGVGLVPANYPVHRQPGWEAGSYGWHGERLALT